MKPLSSVSAVFPCYNDGGTIASMVLRAKSALEMLTDDFEVIVVNDGSSDYSPLVLRELERLLPCLRVVTHASNRGYGGALRSGFTAATKDFVFYTDGDAQYDPEEISSLAAAMSPDLDFVNGYKIVRHDPVHRRIMGSAYRLLMGRLFGLRIRDVDCDFRLFRREVLSQITLNSSSGAICVEMVRTMQNAGVRMAEVPVHHYARPYGRSQFFHPGRILRTFRDLFGLWWRLVVRQTRQPRPVPGCRDVDVPRGGDQPS